MTRILALDVSTSCTGVCAIDDEHRENVSWDNRVCLIDRVEFKGCRTFWEKVDRVDSYFCDLSLVLCRDGKSIDRVVLEEPLLGFRPGMSSAQTISQLLRFNGIVSNIARTRFGVVPEYVSANHARKVAGVRLQRTGVAGMSQKEQVFVHMRDNDLAGFPWPRKKDGSFVDWSRDATDAYVIAKAALLEGVQEQPPRLTKKSRKAARA